MAATRLSPVPFTLRSTLSKINGLARNVNAYDMLLNENKRGTCGAA